jgi:hypothetical protein
MTSAFAAAGRRDPLSQHIHLVDVVAAITEPPKEWTALRARWDAFTDFTATPLLEKLTEAVVSGSGDLPILRALANAEAAPERADIVIAVRAEVYPRLIAAYSEAAPINYDKVAKEFDTVASAFTAAAKQCDPEADSSAVVGQPDSVRQGWLESTVRAAELDRLVPVLCAAAELCGTSTREDTMLLPLLIDTAGLHRRRVWEAWQASGERCDRWGALAGLGARIRAADLEGFEPYRARKPLIRKQFPVGGPDSKGIYKPVLIDPEDEDHTPPPEEPKGRRGRVLVR